MELGSHIHGAMHLPTYQTAQLIRLKQVDGLLLLVWFVVAAVLVVVVLPEGIGLRSGDGAICVFRARPRPPPLRPLPPNTSMGLQQLQ